MTLVDGEKRPGAVDEIFDYVIVGSGAAGGVAARVLADSGASVAIVEEGPAVERAQFGDRLFPALHRLFRDMGGLLCRAGGAFVPIIQGMCVGGGTTVNSAIIWRLPEDVWTVWRDSYGLGEALPYEDLQRHWQQLEEELQIAPTPEKIWGRNNEIIHQGRTALGLRGAPTQRSVAPHCTGSARCISGCPHDAKQSTLISYLPYATERGATLFASARVDRVVMEGCRAVGVRGQFHHPASKRNISPFNLRARRAVLIAASAIQTPLLLQRSGVRSPKLGLHFQAHPGSPMLALFDEPVNMWLGATQGYDVDHHRREHRFKIEVIAVPPEMLFERLPGMGRRWLGNMAKADHIAMTGVQLRALGEGRVRARPWGNQIRFRFTRHDMANLKRAFRCNAELFFAAGARAVFPGIHGLPERITSPDQLQLIDDGPDDPAAYQFIMSHLFGTARMSADPHAGVVDTDFSVHNTEQLFVIDSSIFPTNLGVNPQHTIMAVAMQAAQRVAEAR